MIASPDSPPVSAAELADPLALARALVRRPSVTPEDAGAQDVLAAALEALGFRCERMRFEAEGTAPVENLYARFGTGGPHFCFAGHTDVVPTGDRAHWRVDPFAGEIQDGVLWGRGAADMKGAIAAFVAACARVLARGAPAGSVSLLITGDEEGPAINGTRKMLETLAARGECFDHCLVGEPTNPETMGEMMKVGRRGSLNAWLTVDGRQGHVAYPHRAENPIPKLLRLLTALSEPALDDGFPRFDASNLEITEVIVGNPAHNVIPARARARVSVRFNPTWTGETLIRHLEARLERAAAPVGARWTFEPVISGEAFLTTDDHLARLVEAAAERHTGRKPERSTTGGTSDARFIKNHAPVVEFGLVGATIHQIDEHARVADIRTLADIYETTLSAYFATPAGAAPR